jgi:hypothetical protein
MSPVDLKEALKTLKMSRPYDWHGYAPPGTPVQHRVLKSIPLKKWPNRSAPQIARSTRRSFHGYPNSVRLPGHLLLLLSKKRIQGELQTIPVSLST